MASLLERQWFRARDVFLGINGREQDLRLGLQLASQCDHEDARWLCDTFLAAASGSEDSVAPRTAAEARSVFLRSSPEDVRALAFAALVCFPYKAQELRQAAERGLPLAQGFVAALLPDCDPEKLTWASRAAAQRDPQGMCLAAEARMEGGSCPLRRSCDTLGLLRAAAESDWMHAQVLYGMTFSWDEPARYAWMAKGRALFCSLLLDEIPKQLEAFDAAATDRERRVRRAVVFEIGKALAGQVQLAQSIVFARPVKQREKLLAAHRAAQLYEEWCERARRAAVCWVLVGRRLGLCRDVVGIVARLVWKSRETD